MALPNPFRRRDENTRTCWGYTFQFTQGHLTADQARPLKFSYDRLGEECLNLLNDIDPPSTVNEPSIKDKSSHSSPGTHSRPKRDLYQLLKNNAVKHPKLLELWTLSNQVPEWVDWDQISLPTHSSLIYVRVGQKVFYRYGAATLTGLAYQALLGGMAANRVVEVLARTGGFSVKVARHRLFETTQHILECTKSLESIQPGGAGFASSIRVRLLHAAVRQRILKLEASRPGYYNVEEFGVPINDLDCIGTICTFSATIIWISLPRQGLFPRRQEMEDYTALWRLIAHYTGTSTESFETPEKARMMMESLMLLEMNPSEISKVLAGNVIRCLEAQPPAYLSRSFLEVNARWLNGNALCDRLGLGRPSLYYWALMAGQCLFFMAICYTYRSFEYLDRRKVEALRKVFWNVIVEGKHGLGQTSVFDFKYVPDYHVMTGKSAESEDGGVSGIKHPGVERRNLKALVIGVTTITVGTYASVRLAASVLQWLQGFWAN